MTFGNAKEADLDERKSPPLLKEEILNICMDNRVMNDEKCDIADLLDCIRCNNVDKLAAIICKIL